MNTKPTCWQQWLIKSSYMRIDAALKMGTDQLQQTSESARLDAEILLAHCLGKQHSYLYTWPEKRVSTTQLQTFESLLKQRLESYPIAYMTGFQAFWSLTLKVTPDVLIPRADTELLVETALDKLATLQTPKILELGTGSGAISLALATERPDSQIIATDYSLAALDVAKENQQRLQFGNIQFIESDWFSNIPAQRFDLIVSNPPYIDPNDDHLRQGIRHEPIQALISANKGLQDLTSIIQQAPRFLNSAGWLMLEHGYDQGIQVSTLLDAAAYQHVHCLKDLSGNDRINVAASPNQTSSSKS
ncbi:MAG: peptide chain release factor N(5)-glutamine methyltransferase [Leucothrix sp.]